ncbi:MAG: 6-pyruvoyl-tetrahydropterin synthase-related protein [Anaerolineales bacterium]
MRTRLSNWFQLNARTALIVGALAALPLFLHAGFLNTRGGGDSPFLLFRLHQLLTALGAGQFPARWMPDAAYGLGYPFFHYYAALSFYIAAAFKLLGFSYVLALKLTQLAGFLAAAAGMYGWIRAASGSRPAAWLAAAAYTFAPFHMVNVYVRGDSLAEFWAMALFPLCLWAAHALTERATLARVAAFAASYGALVFTHNVSALIFTPLLLLYLAARSGRKLLPGVAGLAGGLALAAFFWAPALLEQDFAQLAPVTEGYFHYANHFRAIDLLQTTLLFNYNVGSPDTTPFAMGILQAALTVLGLLALLLQVVVQRRNVRHALFLGSMWALRCALAS